MTRPKPRGAPAGAAFPACDRVGCGGRPARRWRGRSLRRDVVGRQRQDKGRRAGGATAARRRWRSTANRGGHARPAARQGSPPASPARTGRATAPRASCPRGRIRRPCTTRRDRSGRTKWPGSPRPWAWRVSPTSQDAPGGSARLKDDLGPSLQGGQAGAGRWTFARFVRTGADNCRGEHACPRGRRRRRGRRQACGERPGREEAAKKAAAPVLKALGQHDATLDASQLMGAVRVVNAAPDRRTPDERLVDRHPDRLGRPSGRRKRPVEGAPEG